MDRGLSKSKLLSFRQCPKKVWLEVHRPELAEADPKTEAIFAIGHEIGGIARRLYDDGTGIMVQYEAGMTAALAHTSAALSQKSSSPIFEATVERDGLLVRADVLLRDPGGPRLVEVKASTKLKPEYLNDCAIQSWVFEASPAKLSSVALAHVNNQFVYQGDGNYIGLLTEVDVSTNVAALRASIPAWLEAAKVVLTGDEPQAEIGTRCWTPYDCPFQSHCWKKTPYPLTGLPGIGRRLNELLAAGYQDVSGLPETLLRSAEQQRVWRAVQSGKPSLSPAASNEFAVLGYPRYYLDFETVGPAVPRWAGTRPYQPLPFQWSLHIENQNGELRHEEFLSSSGELPARAVSIALLEATGREGPIFMYTSYERKCIEGLAALCPELGDRLKALADRLVDLHPIAKQHYYHPAMHGSWSIKAVLPTIAPELDYSKLGEIREGMAAQQAYLEAIDPSTTFERRMAIRQSMLDYCKHDTLAMVTLARFLEGR